MKFYKSSNGKWVIGHYTGVPTGTCSEHTNPATGKITIRGNGIMYADNVLPTEFQKENGDNYANLIAYEEATKDFFVKALASGGGMTDFVLIDVWESDTEQSYTPDDFEGLIGVIGTTEGYLIYKLVNTNPVIMFGLGSNPYVPISKTTIFVHPTTSERYIFNGTTMEVYNDVDGIVPKWLEYKALLTQSGVNAPVARVLNQDERNYLGDIEWTREWNGTYHGSNKHYNNFTFTSLISQMINPIDNVGYAYTIETYLNENGIGVIVSGFDTTTTDSTTSSDNKLFHSPIETKVRLRGAPPKLLSAETNTTGDKIILTFNKEIKLPKQVNGNDVLMGDYFVIEGNTGEATWDYSQFTIDYTNTNKIIISNTEGIIVNYNDELTLMSGGNINFRDLNYPTEFDVDSIDFGILQPINNFPVTNNVPAPPQLLDAYTDITGTILYMTFDKEMDVDLNSWYAFGWNSGIEVGYGNYSYNPITKTLSAQIISTISAGEPLTLSYDIARGHLKSMDGVELQPFSDYTVTNNIQ